MQLTVGSLFSGCGGLDLGFERKGFITKWMCESDKWCRKILETRFPQIYIHEDARTIEAESVDVLIGGFPCQPVSNAGVRLGVDDSRWLWPAYDRAIRLLRPKYAVVENVQGLFARGFSDVLGSLADAGYDAEWFCLQSSDIGAPHRRKRVYIIATDTSGERFREDSGSTSGYEGKNGFRKEDDNFSGGNSESKFKTTINAIPDSKRQQGFSQADSKNGRVEVQNRNNSDRCDKIIANADSKYVNRSMERGPLGWDELTDFNQEYYNWGDYRESILRWESIIGKAPNPKDEKGRLSSEFVEWMMGFPKGWTEGVSKTQRLKMLGNSVQVQCAEKVAEFLKEKEFSK